MQFHEAIEVLPDLRVRDLHFIAGEIGAPRGRRIKGGKWRACRKHKLVKVIRRTVANMFDETKAQFVEAVELVRGTLQE